MTQAENGINLLQNNVITDSESRDWDWAMTSRPDSEATASQEGLIRRSVRRHRSEAKQPRQILYVVC
jgi:hypothetical protein